MIQTCSTFLFIPHLAAASYLLAELIIATIPLRYPHVIRLYCLANPLIWNRTVHFFHATHHSQIQFRNTSLKQRLVKLSEPARSLPQLLTKNTISGIAWLILSITEGYTYKINKTASTTSIGHADEPTCTLACRPLSCCTGPGTSWLQ